MSAPATSPLPEPLEALNAELARRDAVQSAHSRFYLKPSVATAEALAAALAAWAGNERVVEYRVVTDIVDSVTGDVVRTGGIGVTYPNLDSARADLATVREGAVEISASGPAVAWKDPLTLARTVLWEQNPRIVTRTVTTTPWSVVEQEKN